MSDYILVNGELMHYGVLGMKWGKRKNNYHSTSIGSAIARKQNEKVDKGFKKWDENAKKKETAIELGKKANVARIAYEKNKSDATLKSEYKQANKAYKKALGQNTTYRKGVVRQEVGRDASRKYLSEAKKLKKQLTNDPTNKDLQKKYDGFMSKHDIERAKARRAADVGRKRSNRIASVKRGMTIAAKTAAVSAAVSAGAYAANKYFENHQTTLNGKPIRFKTASILDVVDKAKKVRDLFGYIY